MNLHYWRYAVGAFHSPSDHVVLASAPIGTFSTGQHGAAAKHRRARQGQSVTGALYDRWAGLNVAPRG